MPNDESGSVMQQRAVITGAAGFVGSHLVERLLTAGVAVVALDNLVTGSPANLDHLYGSSGFEFQHVDVSDPIRVDGPVDYVLHFASPASPIDYAELPIQTLKVGSRGTLNTLGLARAKGARYLLASTSETYGDPLVHPQPESYWGNVNPIGPRSCYDEAKRFAEAATTAYRTKHDVNTSIVRIFNTYGPRMRPNDGRAIPNFVAQALDGRPITVAGDGSQTRSICYVDDLVEGIVRLLFSSSPGPMNVGNPEEMSILKLAELVRELCGSSSPIEFVDRPTDDPSQRRPDITAAKRELAWSPIVGASDGLRRTIEWFASGQESEPVRETTKIGPRCSRMAVIGTGYVGAVTSTCFASLGHEVWGFDVDQTQVSELAGGEVPFFEPGLDELLRSTLTTGRLHFTSDPEEALQRAEVIFLCVGTPIGATGQPDLTQLEEAVRLLAPHLASGAVVVTKSTVPVGSGNWVRTVVEDALPEDERASLRVVSNPEFLREGSAIEDFLHPDRIVLGGDEDGVARVAALYRAVLDQSFPQGCRTRLPSLIITELTSAEMIKYAANAFLATKISFANEVAQLCELVGADAREVLPAIGADHRIGTSFLAPGVGWGGSCFGKDIAALVATGQEYGYTPSLLRATLEVNDLQRAAVIRKLQRRLHVLKGRRIALLGLTFKPNTDDLRDAPAIDFARRLVAAGCTVSAYDPIVKKLPADLATVRLAGDICDAADRADAVVVVTEWPDIVELDPQALARVMRGRYVLDGRNVLDDDKFGAAGLVLEGIGR